MGLSGKLEDNFYFKLNEMLRERSNYKLNTWKPFLYHFLNGLRKLPLQSAVVYRGIRESAREFVVKEYTQGRKVHWSAFSSTSTHFPIAKSFAGKNGLVLKIKVVSGVNISAYSVIQSEQEVLLSPNLEFVVASPLHQDNGMDTIELVEIKTGNTMVF